jgi:MFS family permease
MYLSVRNRPEPADLVDDDLAVDAALALDGEIVDGDGGVAVMTQTGGARGAALDADLGLDTGPPGRRRRRVSANVIALGFTSMFTDISSEMVTAVLPLYLTIQLGLTPFQFGAFDGVYQAIAALAALGGALIADRRHRYKEVAGAGYGLSAVSRLGLLISSQAWAPVTGLLYLDRAGKGLRTAPRDALISLSSRRDRLAESFGVHRALDTAGALMGPLLAFGLLQVAPGDFHAVFVVSFCAASVGLAVLVLFVRNRPPTDGARPRRTTVREIAGLVRLRPYTMVLAAALVLGCFKVSDALLFLTFQRETKMNPTVFPLLYVGSAVAYLLLAVPVGRLADRVGRRRVFLSGFGFLVGVYLVLAHGHNGAASLVLLLGLLGAFYAFTDGVLAAIATSTLPEELRSTGVAVLYGTVGAAGFVSSLMFGALWSWHGPATAIRVSTIGLVVAVTVAAVLLRTSREPAPAPAA